MRSRDMWMQVDAIETTTGRARHRRAWLFGELQLPQDIEMCVCRSMGGQLQSETTAATTATHTAANGWIQPATSTRS
jgi:hypothetical protein